ncbi:T9SS type A sorting domain-containing protein [Pontibacter sp. 172403-2]|uniref:T9SS type A sorting domain-containing protein n=1 Tax=Pontibacter rufus TaxID=2791028 RepID=UPI0018AFDA7D|nr:T9SS type A sorting domain-containing protein [Pontibacter sp. 172403-2]MBF9252277.1 T9SS type A sorting domain-containing protein [Pontibacter sp. 172403-2]
MIISTQKIFLAVMLLGTYLTGFVGKAYCKGISREAIAGVLPVYKGGVAVWAFVSEQHSQLAPSAQNAHPHILTDVAEHSCSKIYASAVGQVFHTLELRTDRNMYAASLVALAPSRNLIKELPSINAYPNPSRGITLFSLNLTANDNYKIRISNTIGRVVTSAEVLPASANTVVQLDMSSLPSGVYFYSLLVNDKTVETKRLILQK